MSLGAGLLVPRYDPERAEVEAPKKKRKAKQQLGKTSEELLKALFKAHFLLIFISFSFLSQRCSLDSFTRLVEVAPSFARIFKGGPQREKSDLPARP